MVTMYVVTEGIDRTPKYGVEFKLIEGFLTPEAAKKRLKGFAVYHPVVWDEDGLGLTYRHVTEIRPNYPGAETDVVNEIRKVRIEEVEVDIPNDLT